IADHSGAAADCAFFDIAVMSSVDGMESVFGLHVETIDVVEPAIPGFGNDRQRPPIAGRIGLAVSYAPLDDRIAYDSNAVGVGDGVEFCWSAVKGDAEIASAGFFGRSLLRK